MVKIADETKTYAVSKNMSPTEDDLINNFKIVNDLMALLNYKRFYIQYFVPFCIELSKKNLGRIEYTLINNNTSQQQSVSADPFFYKYTYTYKSAIIDWYSSDYQGKDKKPISIKISQGEPKLQSGFYAFAASIIKQRLLDIVKEDKKITIGQRTMIKIDEQVYGILHGLCTLNQKTQSYIRVPLINARRVADFVTIREDARYKCIIDVTGDIFDVIIFDRDTTEKNVKKAFQMKQYIETFIEILLKSLTDADNKLTLARQQLKEAKLSAENIENYDEKTLNIEDITKQFNSYLQQYSEYIKNTKILLANAESVVLEADKYLNEVTLDNNYDKVFLNSKKAIEVCNNFISTYVTPTQKAGKKPSQTYTRTVRKHTDAKGVTRTIFTKGKSEYVRVKKQKSNEFTYRKITDGA